jgi:YidC/Oxa1 family membrane protein insertase
VIHLLAITVPGFPALEHLMKAILDFLHTSVGLPWAWSIVALTILVRICLVPLTVKQIHSMQALQRHAPEMKEIQKKYKGDRQKLNEELMKFYRENHINPAASCLPLVAQFPVFIALYLTLKHYTHDITGTWLHVVPNISDKGTAHWSGFVLLAVYAGSQVASTYFMGTTMDKTQRNIMMVLPLVFITVVSRFPVGLILYWMTTNLWTVGQGLVTRKLVPKTPAPKLFGRKDAQADTAKDAPPKRSSRAQPRAESGSGNGSAPSEQPKPKPAATQQPRRVKRKKGGSRR